MPSTSTTKISYQSPRSKHVMFTVTKAVHDFSKNKYDAATKVADGIDTYEGALDVATKAKVFQDMPPIIVIYDDETDEHTEVPLFGKVVRGRTLTKNI